MMVEQERFPRPSIVYLDGDQDPRAGCNILPGGDVPERVVFEGLAAIGWPDIPNRIERGAAETIDALNAVMVMPDHHLWVNTAGDRLVIGGDMLWQVLASSWVKNCLDGQTADAVCQPVRDALAGV
ncbi:hypothetical protein [Paracoccus sp. (in: a-proteobacteria)]|uniref:hypothetical protein n=1 Tax=Paracoccus sp. TaxID=267 RepID=UPI00272ABF68|nr:hypothetical protein [Paracoccus sp. (in: a-proteobacteria)]